MKLKFKKIENKLIEKGGNAGIERIEKQKSTKRKEGCGKRGRWEFGVNEAAEWPAAGVGDGVTQLWVKDRSLSRGFSIELRVSEVLCHSYSPIKP